MKKIIYENSVVNIADLLIQEGIQTKRISRKEISKLRKRAEKYLIKRPNKNFKVRCDNIVLILNGVDEVGFLYWYLC